MDKKTDRICMLIQWAIEIMTKNMVLIDDHQGLHTIDIDHLVIVETGEGVFLCPVIDSTICCCLNAILKDEDGGYHLSCLNVGGNVWNKDKRKNISDRCADYNAADYNAGSKIIRVIC